MIAGELYFVMNNGCLLFMKWVVWVLSRGCGGLWIDLSGLLGVVDKWVNV